MSEIPCLMKPYIHVFYLLLFPCNPVKTVTRSFLSWFEPSSSGFPLTPDRCSSSRNRWPSAPHYRFWRVGRRHSPFSVHHRRKWCHFLFTFLERVTVEENSCKLHVFGERDQFLGSIDKWLNLRQCLFRYHKCFWIHLAVIPSKKIIHIYLIILRIA